MIKTQFNLCLNFLSIMVALLLCPAAIFAQQDKQQKQLFHAPPTAAVASTLSIAPTSSGIHLVNGKKNITISNKSTDSHAVLLQDEVYFIRQQNNSDAPTTLMVYDIAAKQLTDKLSEITAGSNYDKKAEIFKLLADNKNQKLYICARIKTAHGNYEAMTWCYNKNTKVLKAYRDGEMDHIDADGNQTFLITNRDEKGTYTGALILNPAGATIKELPRNYKSVHAIK